MYQQTVMENHNDNHAEMQLFLEVVVDLWLCYDPFLKLLAVIMYQPNLTLCCAFSIAVSLCQLLGIKDRKV